ncbi:MerR family transcriptional regulator [Sporolactobacillus shoreicorticis]|uniref:MerR family transcriptional regulator n=1 Tax=Sporolactobacillus shoreicorticis TaxID=1923877 RepID=A0ABW5RZ95_9BACL|nr:MerR family transcriptional regulator [Sporolactobacillus shoreicorticis]MCO7126823.1 MerR family transcriptional regulator [Sporolactobacillus shoreicorticis]
MKIGEFVKRCKTTKDTVRYYEELALLQPDTSNRYKAYNQKNLDDFMAIKEMQCLGLSLKVIQNVFEMKKKNGCGSQELIRDVTKALEDQEARLMNEEIRIHTQLEQLRLLSGELQSLIVEK